MSTIEERLNPADSIAVTPEGYLEIRESSTFLRDGVAAGPKSYHRYVLFPGDAVADKDPRIQRVAAAVWTDEVVAAYAALIAAAKAAAAKAAPAEETEVKA